MHNERYYTTDSEYIASQHLEKLRNKLLALLPQDVTDKTHIILLAGERTGYRNDTDRELRFRQESNFFWLTGCDIPASYVILVCQGSSSPASSYLFIPEEDPLETLWSPAPPSLQEARKLFDANHVGFSKDFTNCLTGILKKHPNHCIHTLPESRQYPAHSADVRKRSTDSQYLLTAIHRARLTKDDYEIALIRKANDISSRAHEVVMRLLGQGVIDKSEYSNGTKRVAKDKSAPLMPSEWRIEKEAEAEAVFVATCRREG
jgi:Xaa-Pro dipeptidase